MSQIIIQPGPEDGRDATIESFNADMNTGTRESISVGGFELKNNLMFYRALLRFDLSPLVGKHFSAITLVLMQKANMAVSFDCPVAAHRITQTAWTEMGVTWNTYDGTQPWASPGGDYDPVSISSLTVKADQPEQVLRLNVTDAAVTVLNGGGHLLDLVLIGDETQTLRLVTLCSSDYLNDPSRRPKLVVSMGVGATSTASTSIVPVGV